MVGPTEPRPGGESGMCLVGNVENVSLTSQGLFARTLVTPEGVPVPARALGVLIALFLTLQIKSTWPSHGTSMTRRWQR